MAVVKYSDIGSRSSIYGNYDFFQDISYAAYSIHKSHGYKIDVYAGAKEAIEMEGLICDFTAADDYSNFIKYFARGSGYRPHKYPINFDIQNRYTFKITSSDTDNEKGLSISSPDFDHAGATKEVMNAGKESKEVTVNEKDKSVEYSTFVKVKIDSEDKVLKASIHNKGKGHDNFYIHLHLISDIDEVTLKDTKYYFSDNDKSETDLLYQYDVLDNDPIRLTLDNTFSDYYGL